MNVCLNVKEISFQFRDFFILKDISFFRNHPGITVILGENGVGKSVFLRLLAGIYYPQKGKILLHNASFEISPHNHLARQYIGYQNEDFSYWNEYQVKDIIQIINKIKMGDLKESITQNIYNDILETFHLKSVENQSLKTLSLGYQRRLSLALSTLGSPKILLLDEPINGLDPSEKEFFTRWLEKTSQSCHVFLSSHYLEEIAYLKTNTQVLLLAKTQLQTQLKYDGPTPNNLRQWYREQHEKL